jgi:hypothetical protein
MTAIVPVTFRKTNRSAIRQRVNRLHDEAASGLPEAVCAIVLVSCLITALGQCIAQIVA